MRTVTGHRLGACWWTTTWRLDDGPRVRRSMPSLAGSRRAPSSMTATSPLRVQSTAFSTVSSKRPQTHHAGARRLAATIPAERRRLEVYLAVIALELAHRGGRVFPGCRRRCGAQLGNEAPVRPEKNISTTPRLMNLGIVGMGGEAVTTPPARLENALDRTRRISRPFMRSAVWRTLPLRRRSPPPLPLALELSERAWPSPEKHHG